MLLDKVREELRILSLSEGLHITSDRQIVVFPDRFRIPLEDGAVLEVKFKDRWFDTLNADDFEGILTAVRLEEIPTPSYSLTPYPGSSARNAKAMLL